jgi:hypothetical protein
MLRQAGNIPKMSKSYNTTRQGFMHRYGAIHFALVLLGDLSAHHLRLNSPLRNLALRTLGNFERTQPRPTDTPLQIDPSIRRPSVFLAGPSAASIFSPARPTSSAPGPDVPESKRRTCSTITVTFHAFRHVAVAARRTNFLFAAIFHDFPPLRNAPRARHRRCRRRNPPQRTTSSSDGGWRPPVRGRTPVRLGVRAPGSGAAYGLPGEGEEMYLCNLAHDANRDWLKCQSYVGRWRRGDVSACNVSFAGKNLVLLGCVLLLMEKIEKILSRSDMSNGVVAFFVISRLRLVD